jgi:hypothetical protein
MVIRIHGLVRGGEWILSPLNPVDCLGKNNPMERERESKRRAPKEGLRPACVTTAVWVGVARKHSAACEMELKVVSITEQLFSEGLYSKCVGFAQPRPCFHSPTPTNTLREEFCRCFLIPDLDECTDRIIHWNLDQNHVRQKDNSR